MLHTPRVEALCPWFITVASLQFGLHPKGVVIANSTTKVLKSGFVS